MKVDVVVMGEEVSPRRAIAAYDLTFLMASYDGTFFDNGGLE